MRAVVVESKVIIVRSEEGVLAGMQDRLGLIWRSAAAALTVVSSLIIPG